MKKVLLYGLLLLTQGLCAQMHTCPMRIVPGDPRNNGQEQQMQQTDHQRRIAEAQNEAMHTPGICTRTLPPRVLVIMANFSDYTFSTTKEHADSLFNAVTPLSTYYVDTAFVAHGSVASYFDDQSLGQYRPQFDVVGPVNLSKSYAYYGQGKNASAHAGEMVVEACDSVKKMQLADFSLYDADGDNYIDLVFVFFAGFGENDGNYITQNGFSVAVNDLVWPHYSTISGTNKYDGKILRAYECSNELDGYYSKANPKFLVPAGSGILVHEFSHGLGLPDVYAGLTQYMGTWDLMDYGCYSGGTYIPAPYTGWERWFMGWSKPQWMNEAKNVTLRPISESGDFGVITSDGQPCDSMNTTTYWIVENHQSIGWDQYTAGEGLILYQLKYHSNWRSNAVNSESDKCYVLKPADGQLRYKYGNDYYVGKEEDCYPHGALDSINVAPNYPITHIQQETNGDITFQVCGGVTPTALIREDNNPLYPTKIYHNGIIYIRRGDHLYNPMGQTVK